MSFLASVSRAGPSVFTAEAVQEEPANHLNVSFHFYLSKRRKISLLRYAEYCPTIEHDCPLEVNTSALKNDGEVRYSYRHWSQKGPGDLGTQKNSEEGLERHGMVFCYLNTHTAF